MTGTITYNLRAIVYLVFGEAEKEKVQTEKEKITKQIHREAYMTQRD